MIKRYIALLTFAALAMTSQAALMTLNNADFETDPANAAVVSGWDELLGSGSATLERFSTQANLTTGTKALAIQSRDGNILQQAFLTSEVVAGDYPLGFTVEFDYGWRNENTTSPMSIQVALINLTATTDVNAPVIISSQTVDFGLGDVDASNVWSTLGIDHQVSLVDSSLAGDAGDTLGLAFIVVGANSYSPTAWIDNVSVNTIPEPATLGMVALFGGGIVFIRRRLMM